MSIEVESEQAVQIILMLTHKAKLVILEQSEGSIF